MLKTMFFVNLIIGVTSIFILTIPIIKGAQLPKIRSIFIASDQCQSCHNGLGMEQGEDLSIGSSWQSTMMSHSAIDPYWLAGVRREIIDHPGADNFIQDECSKCHKPMQRYLNNQMGQKGKVFAVPNNIKLAEPPNGILANDGVSCTICHQIEADNLNSKESFVGGFKVDNLTSAGQRKIYGPYLIDNPTKRIMQSAVGFKPIKANHLQTSEFCATCHTLYTHSLDKKGKIIQKFPEQVPYLEWQNSVYSQKGENTKTCQTCHMATAQYKTPISSVLGKDRENFSYHSFRGGNFIIPQLLGQNPQQLFLKTSVTNLSLSAQRTRSHLKSSTATIMIDIIKKTRDKLHINVNITNLAGHKLPTAYPSRRVWIQLLVTDSRGNTIFESGALKKDGSIEHNNNDLDPNDYEPHYNSITSPEQVQIYETIMADPNGKITTGLLKATRYAKDNRILPMGFNKEGADKDIAINGKAANDDNFSGGHDIISYNFPLESAPKPYKIVVRLWYQPISFRWAKNLNDYNTPETRQFINLYQTVSGFETAILLTEYISLFKN